MIAHGRRTAAMAALVCVLCLLAQGAEPSRKLLWTVREEPSHGGLGSHDTGAATTATPEPCSGAGGSGSSRGSAGAGEAKWAEMHTDYIYTQDVKHP
ncbi:phytosulfokines 1-like [Panicum miliaceum]|uniref:Phytosulfokines 1-like n=1 Tax=Panicum miliaceum TaxID=4540 RepID=A0A3L6S1F3_PANMI|nr:phytosulfokines 1-like [Panicum miliaceum]